MKLLVCGFGSIGRRHLANARTMVPDDAEWTVVEPVRDSWQPSDRVRFVADLADVDHPIDVALICSPTHLHAAQIAALAERAAAFFIEKPLAHDRAALAAIREALGTRPVMVGCNYRFETGLVRVRELVESDVIGAPLSIRAEFGQYLPTWRPQQDYRNGYAAKRETGGGVILDRIHELDYVSWLLGPVAELKSFAGRLGGLEIETEDIAEMLLRFGSGAIGSVHVDYVQREYLCQLKIVGQRGSLAWRYKPTSVTLLREGSRWETIFEDPAPDVNAMYIAELRHFFDAIASGKAPMNGLAEAVAITELALAAQETVR